jgi:hypothetical protein
VSRGTRLLVLTGAALAVACVEAPSVEHADAPKANASHSTDLPWPLPLPSSSMELPVELRAPARPGDHLDRAADWLVHALHDAGYRELAFYDVPEGFALATGLELIDDQGYGSFPPDPALRFSARYPEQPFFSMAFWSELLANKTGRFRAFLFVVHDGGFGYAKDVVDNAPVVWTHPSKSLPLSRVDLEYKAQDKWYLLVYEIERRRESAVAKLVEAPTDPSVHFEKSGVKAALAREAGGG